MSSLPGDLVCQAERDRDDRRRRHRIGLLALACLFLIALFARSGV